MMKYVEASSTGTHSVGYTYDSINNLTAMVETIGNVERRTSYTYDNDNRPTSVNTEGSSRNYTYDNAGRVSQDVTKQSSTEVFTRNFTYCNGATSTQVSQINYTGDNYSTYFNYAYDTRDLIGGVATDDNVILYEYDDANQLIRESVIQNGNGSTTCWTYDDAGNILKREVYPYGQESDPSAKIAEVIYTYTDSDWGDLLTSYNGVPITYDGIGNPLNDGTWNYTWQHGRQLASMAKIDQSESWQFTYNADGLRTKRTNGTITYQYTYLGSQLTHMTVAGHTMYFTYDASGVPMSLIYDGETYYYITNLQGDVITILNSSGVEVVRYHYDAWGKLLATTGTLATTIGFYNPLRYRGYVYDEETGLYYVSSRYYDPEIGRWINMDNFISTGLGVVGYNMFAYCNNNPILLVDENGEFPWLAVGIIAVCVIGGGIWGFTRDSKLMPQETKSIIPTDTSPKPPHHNLSPWTPPVNTSPPPAQNNPGKGETKLSTPAPDVHAEELSINDRIENMFIGASMGLAVGGAITSVVGAVGSVAVGSASAYIAAFGGTGAQTFSIGAIAYDLFAMIAAPIFGVEMETIEIEP